MKNTESNKKPIKTGKKPDTTYCFECKDFAHNLKPQEIKMTNEILREKSNCVVCRPSRSRFLKQKLNNKINFSDNTNHQIIKTCIFVVKTVKNIQIIRFQKN